MPAMPRRARSITALLLAAVLLAAAGCGEAVEEGTELTVWVQTGPGAAGEELLRGAERALEEAGGEAAGAVVRLEEGAIEATGEGGWEAAMVGEAARRASEDSDAIAYLAPPDRNAARTSMPITNSAGLLHVSAGPTQPDLLSEPGSNDPPADLQATGARTVVALASPGGPERRAQQYGYEAMALVLDSLARAADPLDRREVVAAALATSARDSALGTYTVDPRGLAVPADGRGQRP